MKLSEQYEQSAVRNDRWAMVFGGLAILHVALVFSDKIIIAILNGLTAVFFAVVTYMSWDMAKIDRLISKSHQETERRRNVP